MSADNLTPALLEWQSLDSHPHNRSPRWYMIGGIFIIAFAVYGLLDESWTTVLVALLMGGMYFFMRNMKPEFMNVRIDGLGIVVAGKRSPWSSLKEFWILTNEEHAELHISRTSAFYPEITIFIQDTDPAAVRETLLRFIPERKGMNERFLDYVTRILKL